MIIKASITGNKTEFNIYQVDDKPYGKCIVTTNTNYDYSYFYTFRSNYIVGPTKSRKFCELCRTANTIYVEVVDAKDENNYEN